MRWSLPAQVYPALRAAGAVARASWRASVAGVYRLWPDPGYALGAQLAGVAAWRLRETAPARRNATR